MELRIRGVREGRSGGGVGECFPEGFETVGEVRKDVGRIFDFGVPGLFPLQREPSGISSQPERVEAILSGKFAFEKATVLRRAVAAHELDGLFPDFLGFGGVVGGEAGIGIFPVGVSDPGADAVPGEFRGFPVESPGVVGIPEETDLGVIDKSHQFGEVPGGGEVSVGFQEDVDFVGAGKLAELGKSLGDPVEFPSESSRVLRQGFRREDIPEDADHFRTEVGSEFEVAFARLDLGIAELEVGFVEADGGGESADDDTGIATFAASGGSLEGEELGDFQEIGFALEETDFEALVAIVPG